MFADRLGKGDEGYTDLMGPERVPKYDLRPETYGTLDEASSTLGLARALSTIDKTREIIREVQHDLYLMMAEVALPRLKLNSRFEVANCAAVTLNTAIPSEPGVALKVSVLPFTTVAVLSAVIAL